MTTTEATYDIMPKLGDEVLDRALDAVWLADLGQGNISEARARADVLTQEKHSVADLASGVVDQLQGRYTRALDRYDRAFATAESTDSALLIASLARLCEVQRGGLLADGRHEPFTEAVGRDWQRASSDWEKRWGSFTESAISSDYRLVANYLHDFLAQLPAIISFAIDLRDHEETPPPPEDLLSRSGLIHALRANERGFWPMTITGLTAAAQISALLGHPERAETILQSIPEERVTDRVFLEAFAAFHKARLLSAVKPWGLPEHLGFLPKDGSGIEAGLPQPEQSEFDRSMIRVDVVAPLFEAARAGFQSVSLTRGASMAECGLAYLDYMRGDWAKAKDTYRRASVGFAWAGDELRRYGAYLGECLSACRGAAPLRDLQRAGTIIGEFASSNDSIIWGVGLGLTCVEVAREALLANDVDACLGAAEVGAAVFTKVKAPLRLAQVAGVRASAYAAVQATNAARVELYSGMSFLRAARSDSSAEAERTRPALLSFHTNLINLASTEADADEVERERREVQELSAEFANLTDEECARVDALAVEAGKAAVELSAGRVSQERKQALVDLMQRSKLQFKTFQLCRRRERARWFDLMAAWLVSQLRARGHKHAGLEEAASDEFETALAIVDARRDLYGRAQLLSDAGRRTEAIDALRAYVDSGYSSWVDHTVNRPSPDRLSRRRLSAQLATDLEAWEVADAEYRKAGLAWDAAESFDPNTHLGGYLDLLNLGILAAAFDRPNVAEHLFGRVGDALETRRRLMSTENLRRALGADPVIHRVYGEWAKFLVGRSRWSDAFNIAELARARTLAESIAIGRQTDAGSAAYQRFREQAGLVERLTGQLAARYRAQSADSPVDSSDVEASLRDATSELRRYEIELLEASPGLRRLQLPRESLLTLDETARLLPPKVLLLAFHLYDRHILAWAVDSSGLVDHTRVERFAGKALDAWVFGTRAREWVRSLSASAASEELEAELSTALLEPFRAALEQHDHVIVIPHRDLSMLPIHAAPWNQSRLGLQTSLSYLPAVTMLKLLDTSSANGPAFVVGDPANMSWADPVSLSPRVVASLPAAGLEAAAVADIYKVEALIGADATESAVRSRIAGRPRTVHFATHGLFEVSSVFDSGIALADGQSLTVDELGALDLHGALVVMSACDTGKGSSQGPELVGVVRALLSAGARAALVSLWAAPDVAALLFMQHFHRLIAGGTSPSAALKATQQWIAELAAAEALEVISSIPERAPGHRARVAMCQAEILALARDYRGALAAITEAEREWERLDNIIHAKSLARERNRYTILIDAGNDAPDLQRRVFASPRFWASFALFGDWR